MVYNGMSVGEQDTPDKFSRLQYTGGGYYFGWSAGIASNPTDSQATSVSNTKAGNVVVTVWIAGSTRVTQTVSYNDGDDFVRYNWAVQNTTGSALADLRFFHGMDSCLGATGEYCSGAADTGAGFWIESAKTVGAYNISGSTEKRFYLQGITPPQAYESSAYFYPIVHMSEGALPNTLDEDPTTDNGYALEWRTSSLAPGAVWSIDAIERFSISADEEDWGDLPNTYNTSSFNNGPRHTIVTGAPYLGSVAPDAEVDGQPTANADGDDTNGTDDEDGVTRAAGLGSGTGGWTNGNVTDNQGGAVNVTISTASACLGAFFDFNGSGTLSAVTLRDNTGAAASQPLAAGSYTFYFDVPPGTFPGGGPDVPVYSRFRVTSPVGGVCTGSPAYSSTGSAPDGEVEDYVWTFTTTAVAVRGFGVAGGLWGMGLVIALAAGVVVVVRRKKS